MKMKKLYFIGILILCFFTSCIPNRDLVYLQGKGVKTQSIQVDSSTLKPYKIQTNDILSISIKAMDQKLVEMFSLNNNLINQSQNQTNPMILYFNGFTVDNFGNIRIPVLGEVSVQGLTIDEIRQNIEKRMLDEYFHSQARLFVTVKLAGLRYTVNGEINMPGTNILYQDRATIMEAIANSGDITITGNRKEVQVIRKYPYGYETHIIDLTDIKSVESPFFYLQPNDYIYIKPLKQKSWGTGINGMQTIATIMTALSLITTTLLLSKNL